MTEEWLTLEEAKARQWESWTEEERAEYLAAVPEAQLRGELADMLYKMRVEAGLTQTELARRMGSRQSFVSAVERGAKVPTLDTLQRMANAAGQRLKLSLEPA
jgi:ribosome-binding protein aMBF1 (putative translation factor)